MSIHFTPGGTGGSSVGCLGSKQWVKMSKALVVPSWTEVTGNISPKSQYHWWSCIGVTKCMVTLLLEFSQEG